MMCSALAEAQPDQTGSPSAIDAGPITDYAKDGAYDKLSDSKKIIIVREGSKIYALTAICTHKMGTVKLKGGQLVCSKHNSHFDNEGKPHSGPAKAALFHLGISQSADGHIMVDKTKTFGEKQWEEAGASLSVKA
jgi:nitrite reductase/ring-hydroxylating ferredoxin subunit